MSNQNSPSPTAWLYSALLVIGVIIFFNARTFFPLYAMVAVLIYFITKGATKVTKSFEKIKTESASGDLFDIVEQTLADGVMTDQRFEELQSKAKSLGLNTDDLNRVRHIHCQKMLQPKINVALTSGVMAPDSYEQMRKMADDLGITFAMPSELIVTKLKGELQADTEPTLIPIEVDLMLKADEQCYLEAPAKWAQETVVKENKGYVGGSLRFRIANGVSVGVGRAYPVFEEYQTLKEVATGTLYLTNKRFYFKSSTKTTSITMGRVADVDFFNDAIEIFKSSGKPDVFFVEKWMVEGVEIVLDALQK